MGRTVADRDGAEARPPVPGAGPGLPRRSSTWMVVLASAGLALSACGLHITRHGVSGTVLGHGFSAATGALPAGFPGSIPVPDHARVLGGGGADGGWDVAFAATGSVAAGTAGYANRFRSTGFTVTDVVTGSTPVTAPGATHSSTGTGVAAGGSEFSAKDTQWTVEVVAGGSTSPTPGSDTVGSLRAGEFAINITAVPVPSTVPTTSAAS